MIHYVKAANAISYIVYSPMLFLSGATMPLQMMPDSIKYLSKAMPITYGVELFQGVWLGEKISNYAGDIVVLLGISIVCTLISVKLFKWE